eukprot:5780247-Amphidinium_carterae.1
MSKVAVNLITKCAASSNIQVAWSHYADLIRVATVWASSRISIICSSRRREHEGAIMRSTNIPGFTDVFNEHAGNRVTIRIGPHDRR